MSRHLRTRNVDTQKRLRISVVDDDDVGEPTNDADLVRILEVIETRDNRVQAEIPIPGVVIKSTTALSQTSLTTNPFKRPHHYIHHHQHCGSGLFTDTITYDLRRQDIVWAQEQGLDEDLLEAVITQYEIEAGRLTQDADCQSVFRLTQACRLVQGRASEKDASRIYSYWLDRRRARGKPLIALFERPPSFDDPSPHVAFRARENLRRICTRNPRKNDYLSFCKLRLLKRDTLDVIHILDQIQKREALKRNRLLLETETFDIRLSQTPYGKYLSSTVKRSANEEAIFRNLYSSLGKSNYELHVKSERSRAPRRPKVSATQRPTNVHRDPARSPAHERPLVQHHIPQPQQTFDFKFANITLSSDEDESEPDTEADIAFYSAVEKYLQTGGRTRQKRVKKPDMYSDHLGYLQTRIQRNGQVWLDPVIFDQMAYVDKAVKPAIPVHHQGSVASKCPASS